MKSFVRRMRNSAIVRIVFAFAISALLLWAIGWVVTGPYKSWVAGFDSNIRYFMRQIQSPMWSALLLTVTKLGSTIGLIIVGCVVGIALIAMRLFRSLLLFVITMAGQAALHHSAKLYFARPRPAVLISYGVPESTSFPSGHAVSSLAMYAAIAWIFATRTENAAAKFGIAASAVILIFLIGMSRAYIGVHYPTDVVAGWLASFVWTMSVMTLDRRPL